MNREIWKDITGYESLYQVSNLGRVKSLSYIDMRGFRRSERMRVLTKSSSGYMQLGLSKNGIEKKHTIHRLMAIEFIPNPKKLKYINHINEIKDDNRLENLEWCTHSENHLHGTLQERRLKSRYGKTYIKNDEDGVYYEQARA